MSVLFIYLCKGCSDVFRVLEHTDHNLVSRMQKQATSSSIKETKAIRESKNIDHSHSCSHFMFLFRSL